MADGADADLSDRFVADGGGVDCVAVYESGCDGT